jgi:alpha-tubulin suppressor-like RCC1 family protein
LPVILLSVAVTACGSSTPTSTPPPTPSAPVVWASIIASRATTGFTCGLTTQGVAYCWGNNDSGQLGTQTTNWSRQPVRVVTALRFRSLALGWRHVCGLTNDSQVYCWGVTYLAGEPNGPYLGPPVALRGGRTFDAVSSGVNFAAGLANGVVYQWRGRDGTAVVVSDSVRFRHLSAGNYGFCGLDALGAAWCWEDDTPLGPGDTRRTVPTPIGGGTFLSISAGADVSCALTAEGEARCWTLFGTPRPVSPGLRFSMISVGDRTCALAMSGEAYCTDGSGALVAPVPGGHRFRTLSVGYRHACAVDGDGVGWCWGDNCDGQLGDGSTPKPCNFVTYADTSAVPLRVKDPAP